MLSHCTEAEGGGRRHDRSPQFNTTRSEIGELLYRLKYRSDRSVTNAIVETAVQFIRSWGIEADVIISVPPSRLDRSFQPVFLIAQGIGTSLNIPLCENCIVKTKDTAELKDVYDYYDRIKLLENAFSADAARLENRNVLLFDDLYRSGATLNAITEAIYTQGHASNVYVLALTRTRSSL